MRKISPLHLNSSLITRSAVGYCDQPAVFHYFGKLITSPMVNRLTAYALCFSVFSFFFFSRTPGQTAGRRWVWRVIPLHLSINLETISSVPLQNVKASLSRRWVHHLLSETFPRVSIKTQKHIMRHNFLLQWVNAGEWAALWAVCKRATLFGKLHDVTGSLLCRWHHSAWVEMGRVPEISCLIGSETLKEMTLPGFAIAVSLPARELGSPITPALAN